MPPTGSTRPRRLISPVIAVSLRMVRSVSSETSAMNIATPALGPSLGVAPAGTWMWMSLFSKRPASMPSAAARFLTRDSAACALSFITSPSWPVRISLPEPGIRVASMKRMSPPTGVQASPVATPGTLDAHRHLALEARRPENLGDAILARDADRSRTALGDAHRGIAQHLADLALEPAHARFAGVVRDDVAQRVLADLDLIRLQPVRLELPPHQIALGDLQLLVGRVAGTG